MKRIFPSKDILNLAPHEVVTLMLMIYFRKSWDETRLYKLIDPSKLQKVKITCLVNTRVGILKGFAKDKIHGAKAVRDRTPISDHVVFGNFERTRG